MPAQQRPREGLRQIMRALGVMKIFSEGALKRPLGNVTKIHQRRAVCESIKPREEGLDGFSSAAVAHQRRAEITVFVLPQADGFKRQRLAQSVIAIAQIEREEAAQQGPGGRRGGVGSEDEDEDQAPLFAEGRNRRLKHPVFVKWIRLA